MADLEVSVVMATCNQACTLAEALESLRAQTLALSRWELIVVNDGSTDETDRVLQKHSAWLRSFRQPNQGLAAACNAGLGQARGGTLARIDSDDRVSPGWLERMLSALAAAPDAACAIPDRTELEGGKSSRVTADPANLYSLIACGTLFRTQFLRTVGGYRPFYWEEYDLYLRLRSLGTFLHVPEPLYTYRRHSAAMTGDWQARRAGWRQLAETWGEQVLRSAGVSPDLEEALR